MSYNQHACDTARVTGSVEGRGWSRRGPSELPQSFPDTVREGGRGGAGVRRQVEGGVTAFTGDPLLPSRTQRGRVFSDVSAVSSITGQTGHGGFSQHWSRPNTRGAARPSRWDAWRPRRDPRCRPAHGVFRIPQSARHSRPRAVWKLTARVVQVCAGDTEARAEQTALRQVRGTALRESEWEPSALRLTRTLRSRRKQVWGRVGHRRSHERPRGATRGHERPRTQAGAQGRPHAGNGGGRRRTLRAGRAPRGLGCQPHGPQAEASGPDAKAPSGRLRFLTASCCPS